MRDLVHLMVQIKRLCINVKIGIDVTPVWVSGGCGRPFIINAHMCAVCYRVGMSEQKCCIACAPPKKHIWNYIDKEIVKLV